jgi:8-oxo-dGTP pyrophosphatase MutT (NUDIX family)
MPHIHKDIDFCVEVYITYQNKVLLRKHDKYKLWLSVGGHIELNEEPNVAATREVREEVGLEIKLIGKDKLPKLSAGYTPLIPPRFMYIHNLNLEHRHIVLVYFAKSKTDKLILSEKEVSEDCRWFTEEELLENKAGISKNVQFYALKALKNNG